MDNPEDHDLTDPFELHGTWWQFDNTEPKKVPGVLRYTPEHGIELELFGSFPSAFFARRTAGPIKDVSIIWGTVYAAAGRNVPISLLNTICTNQPSNVKAEKQNPQYEMYFVNRAIVGVHTTDPDTVMVQSISGSYSNFDSFTNLNPLKAPSHYNVQKPGVVYDPEQPVVAYLPSREISITIQDDTRFQTRRYEGDCTMAFRHEVKMSRCKAMAFSEALESLVTFRNFLSVCSRDSITLKRVRGELPDGTAFSWISRPRTPAKRPSMRDWILTLQHVQQVGLDTVLDKWFTVVKQLGFTGQVLFSEIDAPSPVADARFFYLAACLEAVHREVVRRDMGKFMKKADFKRAASEMFAHFPADLPDGLRESVRTRVYMANEQFYGERLTELFGMLEPMTQQMLTDNEQRFLAAVKQTRNKLAHIDDGVKGEKFEKSYLVHAENIIRVWIVIILLKHCGFEESLLRDRLVEADVCFWGPYCFPHES